MEQRLKQQLQWLGQRILYLSAIREREGAWAETLHAMQRALPYGVWLTDVEGSAGGQLRLGGGAFSDTLVSQFMGGLKAMPRFTNVAFNFTRKDKIGKANIVVFDIVCQVVPLASSPDRSTSGASATHRASPSASDSPASSQTAPEPSIFPHTG